MDTYCEWEWMSHEEGVVLIGCDMTEDGKDLHMKPSRNDTKAATNIKEDVNNGVKTEKDGVAIGKKSAIPNRKNAHEGMIVESVGDYEKFECGLRFNVRAEHKGMWVCEMEKYHWGFGRRYGEVRTKAMALVVTGNRKFRPTQQTLVSTFEPEQSGSVTAPSSSSSSTPSSIITTPLSSTVAMCYKMSRDGDCLAETEAQFKRNFLILQIVVRVAVTVTLLLLAAVFGLLFLRNWRNWEKQINRNLVHSPRHTKDDEEEVEEEHPMLTVALGETRRKSVSFSVCVMGEDFKAFDLERKKVLVGPGGGGTPQQSACHLPTLYEQDQPEKTALQVPLVMKRRVSTRHPRHYTSCTQEEDEKFGSLEVPRNEDRRNSMPPVRSRPEVKLDSLSHSIETVL